MSNDVPTKGGAKRPLTNLQKMMMGSIVWLYYLGGLVVIVVIALILAAIKAVR